MTGWVMEIDSPPVSSAIKVWKIVSGMVSNVVSASPVRWGGV
jgi:hypothetical protein